MKTLHNIVLFFTFSLLLGYSSCTNHNSTSSNSSNQPKDSDKIANAKSEGIHNNYEGLEKLGFKNGDKVSDFTLYTAGGKEVNLFKELKKGRPILLVSGSYSCRPAQKSLINIDKFEQKFKGKMDIYMIQVVEAHPYDTKSPYSETDEIWIKRGLERRNMRAKQPKTYGERKSLAKSWKNECGFEANVLLDSPDNDFWQNYGQAPNTAYLIHPNGEVYHKQVWFDKEEMTLKISELLDEIH